MTDLQKFEFERVFSGDGKVTEPKPRARRSYRAEEVEAIKAQGFAAGEQSAVAKTEEEAAQSITVLAAGIQDVLGALRAELDLIRDDSTRIAAQIARKFVAHMIDTAPELFLERCIDECLALVRREPEILIDIPLGAAPSLKQHLTLMAARHGLDANLRIEESAGLKGAACRLNWRSGGAEISLEEALTRMDQVIDEHIAALARRDAAAPPQAMQDEIIRRLKNGA